MLMFCHNAARPDRAGAALALRPPRHNYKAGLQATLQAWMLTEPVQFPCWKPKWITGNFYQGFCIIILVMLIDSWLSTVSIFCAMRGSKIFIPRFGAAFHRQFQIRRQKPGVILANCAIYSFICSSLDLELIGVWPDCAI